MKDAPTKYDDVIDSRDVIERIEELRTELDEAHEGDGSTDKLDLDDWIAQAAGNGDAAFHEEASELTALEALAEEAEGYAADWKHGETLIRDSYFENYALELADDIGAINADATWPNNCIDWERAARELQQDYTSVEFDGVTYWVR